VGNAVKFTDRGEIVVRATVAERHPDRILLAVEVIDSGIGIPPEKHAMMFEAFSQANEAITRNFGGTGLGLAICAQLVDLMGGRIAVESALGQGSRFHFTVPLPIDDLVIEKEPDLGLAGMRVLVVEDHPRQRAVLRAMMESWRFEVTEATGTDVREVARTAREGGAPFGMVLLDGNLPGQDSVELAIELRAEHPALALVLLPASGQTIDPRRERQLGTYGHVAKPVLASTLLETVQALLSGGVINRPDRTTAITAAVGRSRRILVAEDNPVNRKLIIHILEKMGHQAVAVGDGRKALAALAGGGFDLVLMDVQMPEMDGLEASRRITQRWPAHERPRIVAMTANAMQGDRQACLAAGMDDYITKPIRVDQLVASLLKTRARTEEETR
jgi:CheY-like chemotaxis protein